MLDPPSSKNESRLLGQQTGCDLSRHTLSRADAASHLQTGLVLYLRFCSYIPLVGSQQVCYLASLKLKLSDPFGHSGFTQEASQLVLSLLSDMLQLNWLPCSLRNRDQLLNHSGIQTHQHRRLPGSSNCFGNCCAPSPVASNQTTSLGPTLNPGGSCSTVANSASSITTTQSGGNLVALLTGVRGAVGGVIDEDVCAYCQDVCWWFELASVLCHHLAPIAPPALPRLELSVASLRAFLEQPGRCSMIRKA